MTTILSKLEAIQKDMKDVCKKDDIANLVTTERLDEKAEEVKDWARERFARTNDVLPRLKALEKQREKDVEQTLLFMRAQSMNSIYIGNLGEDDKDKTIKEWIQKSCKNLGDKYNPSIFPTPDGKKHAVVTFDSNSQAKSFLDALKKKEIKNAAGKPIKVRYNKDKSQRALEAPLLPIQQRLLKLYGGDKGKPTTPVSIQTNKIKVGGAVVIVLDGLGGWRWTKDQVSKDVKAALKRMEGTQEDSEEENEDDGAEEQGMEGLEEEEEDPRGSDDPKPR